MAQLVTLAHRVSSIHARYSRIHDALFGVSGLKRRTKFRDDGDSVYAGFDTELKELRGQLDSIEAILGSDDPLEPSTSYSRKFVLVLKDYVQALSTSILCLGEICQQRNRPPDQSEDSSDVSRQRAELTRYDGAIQLHKRLGVKLTKMVTRL